MQAWLKKYGAKQRRGRLELIETPACSIADLTDAFAAGPINSQPQPGKLRLELMEHVDQRNGETRHNDHEQQCQIRNGQHL
ncbi:hypothetical protein [Bradyrhizobium septentrionale]|uniref:hypothetical protein n=1 Tax=Bradyrhizobium septentrionale TaxID=1404411 RepID=UPI0030CFD1B3